MKKLLLFIPLICTYLACNFSATTFRSSPVTPTLSLFSPTSTPISTPEPRAGLITGTLSYPSEFVPDMRIVAFSLTDGRAYFIDVVKGGKFSMEVPAGTYYVVSYPYEGMDGNVGQADAYTLRGYIGLAGGYSQMVPCGLAAGCDDHTLIPVTVAAGQSVDVFPGDWYAPPGTFPPMPNP